MRNAKRGSLALLVVAYLALTHPFIRIEPQYVTYGFNKGAAGLVADGTPCVGVNSAGTANSPFSCGNITVNTTGDLITCQWGFDGSTEIYVSVSDATNGLYNLAQIPTANGSSLNIGWEGQSYFANAASGTYAPALAFSSNGTFTSLVCQPWKNARTTLALDGGAIAQQNNQTTSTNPTSGSTQTPSVAGELIVGWMTNGACTTPTAGTNYALVTGAAANCQWMEDWIQGAATATNTPYTAASDTWRDQQSAYLPSTAGAGVTPLTGIFMDMEGLSNTVAPTASTMVSSSHGITVPSSSWICQNANTTLTGATAGQLHNLLNNVWVNGTSYSGSGSLGFQYATVSGSPGANNCNLTLGGTYSQMSVSYWFETDIPQNDTNGNQYSINQIGTNGLEQCNPFITANGSSLAIKAEHHGGGSTNTIAIATNTIYQIQEQLVATVSCTIRIYDTSGSELSGSPIICSSAGAGHQCVADYTTGSPNQFELGITGAELESSGHHIWTDDVRIDVMGTFPQPH